MDLASLELVLRGATTALALAAAASIFARRPHGVATPWAAFAVAGIAAFSIASARGGVAALGFPTIFFVNAWCIATPAVAWVLARVVFREGFRPGPFHFAVVGVFAIVTSMADWGRSALGPLGANPEAAAVLMRACRGAALLLLLAACIAAAAQARADLVEARRRSRVAFLGIIALVFMALAGSELVFGSTGAPVELRVAGMSLLCGLAFALVQAVARGTLDEVLAGEPSRSTPVLAVVAAAAPATGLARRVVEEMGEREPWRRERLGIADLARDLGTQEYLLRRTINRDLGYRNFNDFLHDYRLREAARRMSDAAEKRPVLSIALDCGYGSIGPFNRAFKARFGVTPTQYRATRAETRADSGIGATGS